MKLIPATLGFSAMVDDADFAALSAFSWYAHNTGGRGHIGKRPARRTSISEGRKVLFLVHHLVKAPAGMVVDHINGNPWDNRRENLRVCTHAENLRNRAKHRGTSNVYKGVYARGRRWIAIIGFEGQAFILGAYDAACDAARAYDDAALYLHGRFARLNFGDGLAVARDPIAIKAASPAASFRDWSPYLEEVRSGQPASVVARRAGVSVTRLCRLAREAGITLSRGRPTLVSIASRAEAA
jgi:hypothetical protein